MGANPLQLESSPRWPQLEKAPSQQRRPSTAKISFSLKVYIYIYIYFSLRLKQQDACFSPHSLPTQLWS